MCASSSASEEVDAQTITSVCSVVNRCLKTWLLVLQKTSGHGADEKQRTAHATTNHLPTTSISSISLHDCTTSRHHDDLRAESTTTRGPHYVYHAASQFDPKPRLPLFPLNRCGPMTSDTLESGGHAAMVVDICEVVFFYRDVSWMQRPHAHPSAPLS